MLTDERAVPVCPYPSRIFLSELISDKHVCILLCTFHNLQYHMIMQYTKAVEESRYSRNQSELTQRVSSYIRHHLSDSIKTEDIANSLYMSRSHLSTRFKKETGMN